MGKTEPTLKPPETQGRTGLRQEREDLSAHWNRIIYAEEVLAGVGLLLEQRQGDFGVSNNDVVLQGLGAACRLASEALWTSYETLRDRLDTSEAWLGPEPVVEGGSHV
jgi:hypothetical protein